MARPRKQEKEVVMSDPEVDMVVEETAFPSPAPIDMSRIPIEDAAYELLSYLPDDIQSLIKEAKESCQKPLWQMLLGYVMQIADNGQLFVPYELSMWESGQKADAPRPCQSCGNPFKSRFPNAAYCCTPCFFKKADEAGHAEECGLVAFEEAETK